MRIPALYNMSGVGTKVPCQVCGTEFKKRSYNQKVCDYEPCRVEARQLSRIKALLKSYQYTVYA